MTTIEIRSLLRRGKKDLVPVGSVAPDNRRFHSVDGAIELTIGTTPILTEHEWDDVRDLWSYIIGMVDALCRGEREAQTYFPDQPIVFRFVRRSGGMVEVSCVIGSEERMAVVDEEWFLAALCCSGVDFLDHLVRIGARPEDHRADREVLVRCLERLR